MHKLLKRQLKTLSIDRNAPSIELLQFKKLLKQVSKTYKKSEDKQAAIISSNQVLQTVFKDATEGIIIEDKDRQVIHVNDAMGDILETKPKDLLGKHSDFLSSMLDASTKTSIYEKMQAHGSWKGEVEITTTHSNIIYCWLTIDAIMDENHELKNVLIMVTNITDLYHSKTQMQYLASYDTLTNLPNRALLFNQLKQSIAEMERIKSHAMLIFIDIDHFKEFNDNYGHQIGDKVLLTVAEKIKSICREEDVLGRLSGDEFLLISKNVENQNAVHTIIQKIQNLFKSPQHIANLSLHVSISMGVALYPENGETPEALINAADQAMYSVKKNGRNNYAFYSKEMSHIANEYYFIQNALKDAIQAENFTLVYQPQFALHNNRMTGIEVLLRCTHSRISTVPIERLIKIAEETGIISNISYLVINMVSNQLNTWELMGIFPPPLAINLSRKELYAENLILTIHNALARYNLNPRAIELEITESAFLHESEVVIDNITRLQKLGHTFALDDYGTGFSSLSNIKTFHFDKLKIDKSFIDNLHSDSDDQVIVSATITMAKKLGVKVIAEGVETQVQADILKSYGCDIVQGYLYAKPLSVKELEKLLVKSN